MKVQVPGGDPGEVLSTLAVEEKEEADQLLQIGR